jgi:hypothetical protein
MREARYAPFARGARIKIVVGHYGSGKTELSINMALQARREGLPVMLVDLDIVNPFFRSAEQSELLRAAGVEVNYPPFAKTGVDVPVLAADVLSLFAREDLFVVIDVGGDDAGAAALGRFLPYFEKSGYDMLYVVNVFRPFSENEGEILSMLRRIEARARLAVTALISNSNLGPLTSADDVRAGLQTLRAVSSATGIPIAAVSGEARVLDALPDLPYPRFPIERITIPEWMKDECDA